MSNALFYTKGSHDDDDDDDGSISGVSVEGDVEPMTPEMEIMFRKLGVYSQMLLLRNKLMSSTSLKELRIVGDKLAKMKDYLAFVKTATDISIKTGVQVNEKDIDGIDISLSREEVQEGNKSDEVKH